MRHASSLACLLIVVRRRVPTCAQSSAPDRLDGGGSRNTSPLPGVGADGHRDPPGSEKPAADYVKGVLEREGIPVEVFALEAHRPNVVARLKGSGRKRPLLIMGHTDVVNVDPKKWTHPPFSADRDGGYIYGRGTVDDKDNLTAALMVMLLLKRNNVPLDRDVIFLAEAGEEGSTQHRHRVRHQSALRRHRCRVLLRRRRRRHARAWRGPVRLGADRREDSQRHRSDRARPGWSRIGAAHDQRHRPSVEGCRRRHRLAAADRSQRHDGRLLLAAGSDFAA